MVLKNLVLVSRVFANASRKFVTLKCNVKVQTRVSQVSYYENFVIFICNSTRHSSKYSSILRHIVSKKKKNPKAIDRNVDFLYHRHGQTRYRVNESNEVSLIGRKIDERKLINEAIKFPEQK